MEAGAVAGSPGAEHLHVGGGSEDLERKKREMHLERLDIELAESRGNWVADIDVVGIGGEEGVVGADMLGGGGSELRQSVGRLNNGKRGSGVVAGSGGGGCSRCGAAGCGAAGSAGRCNEIIVVGGGGFVVVGLGMVVILGTLAFAFRRTGGGGAGGAGLIMVGIVIGILVCSMGLLVKGLRGKGDFLEKGEGVSMVEEQTEIIGIGAVVGEKRTDGFGHMTDRLAFKKLEEVGAGVGNIVEVDVEFVTVALGKGEKKELLVLGLGVEGIQTGEGVNGNGIRVAKKGLVLVEEDVEGWRQIGKNIEGLALGEGGDSHVAAEEGEIAEGGPFLSQRVERVVEMNRIWG